MSLSLKDIFNRKKVIPINQEFKIGEIVAYFGGSPDYELMAYARIISSEDFEKLGGRKIPDAKKYLETWCYEDRRKGFVYVEAYGRNDSNDIFYNLMPASWIRYIVEDINKEIKDIRGTVENEMENIKLYSKASIEFLKSKK